MPTVLTDKYVYHLNDEGMLTIRDKESNKVIDILPVRKIIPSHIQKFFVSQERNKVMTMKELKRFVNAT